MSIKVSYTEARANLAKLLDDAVHNNEIVIVNRRNHENVAMIAERELAGLLETAHLMRSPKNARRILAAIRRSLEQPPPVESLSELRREIGLDG